MPTGTTIAAMALTMAATFAVHGCSIKFGINQTRPLITRMRVKFLEMPLSSLSLLSTKAISLWRVSSCVIDKIVSRKAELALLSIASCTPVPIQQSTTDAAVDLRWSQPSIGDALGILPHVPTIGMRYLSSNQLCLRI